MVFDQSLVLGICPLVAVLAESGFIDDEVSDPLGVLDRLLVVVDLGVAISSSGMESELDLVDTLAEAEVWVEVSFNHAHIFIETGNVG